jgi:hypothetical protein
MQSISGTIANFIRMNSQKNFIIMWNYSISDFENDNRKEQGLLSENG